VSEQAFPLDLTDPEHLPQINAMLSSMGAEARVAWALKNTPEPHVLSSSFGAQAAVLLHMLTRQQPDMPVVLIDTGYLFAETYRFVDELTERLALNLKVYRPRIGISWMEARYGRLWEQGVDGLDRYNYIRKVEPMERALDELEAHGWFSGLRRDQSRSRAGVEFVERPGARWKFHPIADWTDRDVGEYLKRHGLPYHPLWDEGYVSIGDRHTSQRLEPGMEPEDTRFFGLKRECGIHKIG
jgi:phosphoadenosine phosphosulfate reductase